MVTVNGFEEEMKLIVDSGADTTLISQAALDALLSKPKVKGGQRVSLLQVTGKASISGFVDLDLYFHTPQGPVKLMVEAYVVNGMTTPFLLGTDFQEQYSLSILRCEGQTFLGFGDSGRELEGTIKSVTTTGTTQEVSETEALSGHHQTAWGGSLFVEHCLRYNSHPDNVYGEADTLISQNEPFLHVANFSKRSVVVAEGEVPGKCHNPETWLDKAHQLSPSNRNSATAHASVIQYLVRAQMFHSEAQISSKAQRNATEEDDPLAEEPLEGGSKTAEKAIEHVGHANSNAFGLDGHFGNHPAQVKIQMKPDAKPILLPPYSASPANCEVIDKQIDSWLELGVIEPSKSPWGAPVFIVYQNSKPRMEDILQALMGAQWLSTLDALAGFTQLTMSDESAEKLAFWSH
ncbi:MAG: hypothetical protein NXY57DRAFT_967884 [Lentinula lateritia]|nr:MAG: hypothetical protein NXY57DRAFT_967884 [Lentinula lateritia]